MCVPHLVPIGPQATTCIPSEGYTHTYTHTLSYIDIDSITGLCLLFYTLLYKYMTRGIPLTPVYTLTRFVHTSPAVNLAAPVDHSKQYLTT